MDRSRTWFSSKCREGTGRIKGKKKGAPTGKKKLIMQGSSTLKRCCVGTRFQGPMWFCERGYFEQGEYDFRKKVTGRNSHNRGSGKRGIDGSQQYRKNEEAELPALVHL